MYKANYTEFGKNKKKAFRVTWDDDSSTSSKEEKDVANVCFIASNEEVCSSNEYKKLFITFNELYGKYKEIKKSEKMLEINNKS